MTKKSKNAATSAEMGAVLAQQAAQAKEMHYPGLDQLKAADALQNALQDATAAGIGVTKITFSDEEGPKVERLSHAEFLAEPASPAYTHGLTGMGCGDRVIIDDPHSGPLTRASRAAAAARVKEMLHPEDSYGSAAAMARDLEMLNIKYGAQTPDWAVNTPDPHAPWPDPRPTADAPIIVTFDTSTANYAVDAVRPGETLEQALQRVGGWLKPEHITRIERPEPASDAHGMDFGDAIRCLKRGQRVQRAGWNGRGMWLEYLGVDDWTLKFSKRVEPLILLKTAQDTRVPWTASQADVLADDWRVAG